MATYHSLSIKYGGGIEPLFLKVNQNPNTASIFIGLGRSGVQCVRSIKTEVYDRLIADNPDDSSPRYEHIRFLGIDSDKNSFTGNQSNLAILGHN